MSDVEFGPLSAHEQASYQESLASEYEVVPKFLQASDLWTPYVHGHSEYERLVSMQRALQLGLSALLGSAYDDPQLQRLLHPRLEGDAAASLEYLGEIDLTKQFIRPDYIYNEGQPQICEINTRFIFNGNVSAVHMARFEQSLFPVDIANYEHMDTYLHEAYDGQPPTVFVRGREPMHDLVLQMQRSGTLVSLSPEHLRFLDPRKVGRLVLELHQDELEPYLPDITGLIQKGVPCSNDPRVIWLLHDKRLLVPLSDVSYMSQLVGKETAEVLASGVVPSYHPAWPGRTPEDMPGKTALAKGAISGKSDDQLLVRLADYTRQLTDPSAYVFQPRLKQPKIVATDGSTVEIAGTLPMTLGGEVFGPGIVRVLPYRKLRQFRGFSVGVGAAS